MNYWQENRNTKGISFLDNFTSKDKIKIPIVTCDINGHKLNFILDTGSASSHILQSVVKKLNITVKDCSIDVIGGLGKDSSSSCCVLPVNFNNKIVNELFFITKLSNSFKDIESNYKIKLHGILGSSFLVKSDSVIDYKNFIIK